MSLSDQHWVYSVPLVNRETGERRVVVVELSREEQQDQLLNHALGVPCAATVDAGPIINAHASWRALRTIGEGWEAKHSEIERVHGNVRAIH